jgi:hypothetical protein
MPAGKPIVYEAIEMQILILLWTNLLVTMPVARGNPDSSARHQSMWVKRHFSLQNRLK